MVTRHRFACWRLKVWRERVYAWRAVWLLAEGWAEDFPGPVSNQHLREAEAELNRALASRAKWKRKACENCRRSVFRPVP